MLLGQSLNNNTNTILQTMLEAACVPCLGTIALVIVLLVTLYQYLVKPQRYWSSRGVFQTKTMPILGDSWRIALRKESLSDMMMRVYKEGEGHRYIGTYQLSSPELMIRDIELIKKITVKEFDHFLDHNTYVREDVDPFWKKVVLTLTGERWRDVRATLSPSFTSGKMKQMFHLINEVAFYFSEFLTEKNSPLLKVDVKDTVERFTNDAITSTAFGIKIDSLKNPNNEFFQIGRQFNFSSALQNIRFMAYFQKNFLTPILNWLRIPLFPHSVYNFFRDTVTHTMETRDRNGIVRPDLIHLLMQARKAQTPQVEEEEVQIDGYATPKAQEGEGRMRSGRRVQLSVDDIAAQVLIFFFGGFDTTSILISFCIYELTVNQDVQEKLRKEVEKTWEKCGGKIDYLTLMNMKYLDMVVCETLRHWPIAVILDRIVTKPYTIEPELPHERPVHLEVGQKVLLASGPIMKDPRYFANPDKFDPERFSDERKHEIVPNSYLPFGIGPRLCIGNRYALLAAKVFIFHMVRRFELLVVEETPIPMKLGPTFILHPEKKIVVGFKPRKV